MFMNQTTNLTIDNSLPLSPTPHSPQSIHSYPKKKAKKKTQTALALSPSTRKPKNAKTQHAKVSIYLTY